jgi:uncharacterized membrane protein
MKNITPGHRTSGVAMAHVVYLLQILIFIAILPAIIGVVVAYIKVDSVRGTWLESHYEWQIRTFWRFCLYMLIGVIGCLILIGVVIIALAIIWYVYRVAKGWTYLADGLPVVEYQRARPDK